MNWVGNGVEEEVDEIVVRVVVMNRTGNTWCTQWANMGGQGGNRANRATDLILVSMPKDLGMGNRLRAFPDTPD